VLFRSLRPGATWHERWRGTNAIGTALAEEQALVVHAGEHFLERNAFLTCAAAPIHDPSGRLLGALDLSGDHRGYHRHTLGLVRSAVRMIEHRLFDTRHAAGLRLRLHTRPEGISTLTESLLALSDDGWVIGANDAALNTLGLAWGDIGARQIEQLFELDTNGLHDLVRQSHQRAVPVRTRDGRVLWVRAQAAAQAVTVSAGRPAPARAVPEAARDALVALDTGDPVLRTALDRARRVLDKPIALLLLGESGVGKEVFARAAHASGPRRQQPFVAVN
jgi:transcriptional regulator of acetoin/glycerol metabolism